MAAQIGTTGKLILAFVTLLLGVVLISSIATQTEAVTSYLRVNNETHNVLGTIATGRNNTDINATITYTLTNAPTSWKRDDCPITGFILTNKTGGVFTSGTDYTLTGSAGTYTLVNSATAVANLPTVSNNTYANYDYCGDDYMNSSWGRTGIDLVAGFFALGILIISVGLFYSVAQDTGMI